MIHSIVYFSQNDQTYVIFKIYFHDKDWREIILEYRKRGLEPEGVELENFKLYT